MSHILYDHKGLVVVSLSAGVGKGQEIEVSTDQCRVVRLTRQEATDLCLALTVWDSTTPNAGG